MAAVVTYHIGGYLAAAPQQNRSEQYDSIANTYTRWNEAGTQLEQRALTGPEQARLAAQDVARTAETNGATLRTRAAAALAANATFLALGPTPTAAQVRDQTIRLTKETTALIKLLLNDLQDVNGT